MRTKSKEPEVVVEGSGNVFADLGLPNSGQELMKAKLTFEIARIIKQRGLTQAEAANILGIRQPHVSQLVRNRAGNFSIGRLLELLTSLGQNVSVKVTSAEKEHGELSVLAG